MSHLQCGISKWGIWTSQDLEKSGREDAPLMFIGEKLYARGSRNFSPALC